MWEGGGGQRGKKNLLHHCEHSAVYFSYRIFWAQNCTRFEPKKSRFPGPNPLPVALLMDLHPLKHYIRGRMNHRSINSKYSWVRCGLWSQCNGNITSLKYFCFMYSCVSMYKAADSQKNELDILVFYVNKKKFLIDMK